MTSLRAPFMLALFLSLFAAWIFFGPSSNGVSFPEEFRRQLAFLVGTSVSVLPNEVNTAAERLKEKEAALGEREQAVQEREENKTGAEGAGTARDPATKSSFVPIVLAGVVLFVLIALNFYFDYRRRH